MNNNVALYQRLLFINSTEWLASFNVCFSQSLYYWYTTHDLDQLTTVMIANGFKYLGVLMSDDMTWSDHFGSINSKANKCLFFLRKLNQAGVDKSIMEV